MKFDHIRNLVDAVENELYLMRLSAVKDDAKVVEWHANKIITLSGEIRRECFLLTHVSGEVK